MKKLIIACAAVLVLGLGLTTVGHVLGGQFYSVYYNGALHPFSDAAQNFSDKFVNISDTLSPPMTMMTAILTLTGCRITSKPVRNP